MSNGILIAFTWSAFAAHAFIALVSLRRWSTWPLLPAMNLLVALCVLAYWTVEWRGYVQRGITWPMRDQWIPACAMLVCVLAALTLSGRSAGVVAHGIVFTVDALVLLAAAVFFTFFRMDRMI